MFISDFAIKRPIVTVVSMLTLVVFGLFALFSLDTDEFPDIANPIVNVAVPFPGASPDVVEREVLDPIEEAISGIAGVEKIQGTAQDGFASILVFFDFSKDIQEASQDIRDKISAIRGDLPLEMEEPILARFDPADQPILQIALTSPTLGSRELTRIADPGILRELRSINGVAQASVIGGLERELTVYIEPEKLLAARIGVGQVIAALQQQNISVPVGRIEGTLDERAIRLRGKLESPEEFTRLVVAERNGRQIRLGEVARVVDGTAEQRTLALYNAREAVGIAVLKSKGYSTTDVADRVRAAIDAVTPTLPEGATLSIVQDAGVRVDDSVDNVKSTLIEGALLTVFVVFLFLNSWRSTVITGLALPVSVLAAFIAVWVFGFTLNTMSLLGLSLAIGILIDDAIVVRENIVRHIEMGKDHFQAAHDGTNEIGLAVAATTFSIVAVFVPIAFLQDEAGQWFKPFALTIACAVMVSLFVSFSLDPMLSAYWPDPEIEDEARRNPISRLLVKFNRWFDRQALRYTRMIGWALDHRFSMAVLAIGSFVGAIWLQGTFGGFGFVPVSDRSEMTIEVETPPGSNVAYTRLKVEEAVRMFVKEWGQLRAVERAKLSDASARRLLRLPLAGSISALSRSSAVAAAGEQGCKERYVSKLPFEQAHLCGWCGAPGRDDSRFCSAKCSEAFGICASSKVIRVQLYELEKGVCQLCRLDAVGVTPSLPAPSLPPPLACACADTREHGSTRSSSTSRRCQKVRNVCRL